MPAGYGEQTLFGGEVEKFRYVFEMRLLEVLYRTGNDPEDYESRKAAEEDLEFLGKIATKFGLSDEEFGQIVVDLSGPSPKVSGFVTDEFEGDLRAWMDTREAQEVVFGLSFDSKPTRIEDAYGNPASGARLAKIGGAVAYGLDTDDMSTIISA